MNRSPCCDVRPAAVDGVEFCPKCGAAFDALPASLPPARREPGVMDRLRPLDPRQPYTPVEIEQRILDAVNRLERGTSHEARLVQESEQLKTEFELSFARAVHASNAGAADTRKAQALVACEDQLRALRAKEAERDAMKGVLHSLRSALSGYQSVGRSVTAAYQTGGGNR